MSEYGAILAQWEKGHEIDAGDLLNALKWRVDNQRKQLARLQSERDGLEIQMAQMATVAARQEHRFTALEAQLAEARPDPLIKAKDEAWLRKVTAERDALQAQLSTASASLADARKSCSWTRGHSSWLSGCYGRRWATDLTEFCPYCGHPTSAGGAS